jgi:hypothetical protein
MGFTIEAIEQQKKVMRAYPELYPFYQHYMGNFQFTEVELVLNIEMVTKWIKEHGDDSWRIILEEEQFYLTNT